eukprot:TRINITY_DN35444_c0_g1_i1.p1 TRINITY_DN35444_c0_g1~~TRINITY_DN35444_c0_g1_i1.p1  ORF type:complete len:225 (-),score=51.05 TRINITY_DN35444_c0_g1_i1:552-1163(-)
MASTVHTSFLASTSSISSSVAMSGMNSSLSLTRSVEVARVALPGRTAVVEAATGTKILRKAKTRVLEVGDKLGLLRPKAEVNTSQVKILSKVQDLRLLSKAEQAGLLTLAESLGLSLSAIEKLGLLSKAEEFGILSAATNPKTPGTLLTLALAFLAAGPAAVYFLPEDNVALVVLQVVIAAVSVGAGAAAYGGSKLVATLQKP